MGQLLAILRMPAAVAVLQPGYLSACRPAPRHPFPGRCLYHPPQAFWALLLDVAGCPGTSAAAVLPPLAAALDVWPSLVQPGVGEGGSSGTGGGASLAAFHEALQHLCAQAAAAVEEPASEEAPAAAGAPDAPPPLLLERQPVAAAEFLRRLGQHRWRWAPDAAGSAQALQQLQAATEAASRPGSAAGAAPAAVPAAGVAPAALPARAGVALLTRAAAPTAGRLPDDLGEEEEF